MIIVTELKIEQFGISALQHFMENIVDLKWFHATMYLTITHTKCGLKVSLKGLSFYGINLRKK